MITADPVPADRLGRYPYFDRLPAGILQKLSPHVSLQTVPAGDLILRLGDYSDAAFFVIDGAVEVRVPHGPAGGVEPVRLGTGEIFGEMGALSRFPVTADVLASGDATLLQVGTPALRLMLKQRALDDFRTFLDERYRSRSLASHLKQVALFDGVADDVIDRLCRTADLRRYDPGDVIIEQGATDDGLHLVRGGHVQVRLRTAEVDGHDAAVTFLRRGEAAGELTVLSGAPWPYALSALEHVEIVRIARDDLRAAIGAAPDIEHRIREAATRRQADLDRVGVDPESSMPLEMALEHGLVNGQSVLLIDMTTCTGCDDCVRACADTHGGRPRFARRGAVHDRWQVPTACYECSDPVCMIGCPTGAITRPLGGTAVTIDDETCIGCGNCESRCPWNNILMVEYESQSLARTIMLATKCDSCAGRAEGPACVQMCPHGSASRISFRQPEAVARVFGRTTAKAG
jgi:CRP-like cAMP-binding protein/Fe-S-cluster-containing hydrogenase component 2